VPQAERLISLADRDTKGPAKAISYPNFLDWRQQNRVFETMAAYRVFSLAW
jgi:hypothetical protein